VGLKAFEKEKQAVERDVGCTLNWENLPDKKAKLIKLPKHDAHPANHNPFPEVEEP
jgi:hypothetical protein